MDKGNANWYCISLFFCVTMKPKWKLSGSEMDVKWCSVEVVPMQGQHCMQYER